MSVDWSARYQSGETPWEKGEAHPELPFLLSKHHELVGDAVRILVPGCGFGHDAKLIHSVTRAEVLGLDLAKEAIKQARSAYYQAGLAWTVGDIFTWPGCYDFVFEHTCFCAIPVERRADYAASMARLIPEGGYLLGVFFLNPDHEGEEGPPFGVTLDELKGFFDETFSLEWAQEPAHTYEGREGPGRELSMLWRRKS